MISFVHVYTRDLELKHTRQIKISLSLSRYTAVKIYKNERELNVRVNDSRFSALFPLETMQDGVNEP